MRGGRRGAGVAWAARKVTGHAGDDIATTDVFTLSFGFPVSGYRTFHAIGDNVMKSLLVAAFCLISLSIVGCAGESGGGVADGAESDLASQLAEHEVLVCGATQAIVGQKDGKATLVTLTTAKAPLFALSGKTDTLAKVQAGLSCTKASGAEAASWAAASGLLTYADEIDGLASTVSDEMASMENESENGSGDRASAAPKPYTIFVVATRERDQLDLGAKVTGSAGALATEDDAEGLDEQDFSYGGISACYALGGGDDYGEWFQAASDGIYLSADILPALGGSRAGYIAHEKVNALKDLTDGTSAVEITVGQWTFLLPDGFSR